jgi:lipid A 3-O-deacylase
MRAIVRALALAAALGAAGLPVMAAPSDGPPAQSVRPEAAVPSPPAPVSRRAFALQVDNDEFASPNRYDRWYSQSIRLHAFDEAPAGGLARRLADGWCAWQACASDAAVNRRFSLGQSLYMQHARRMSAPDPQDRPMAGWLWLSGALLVESRDETRMAEWQLGLTGPGAFAEPVQRFWHQRVLGVDPALGWDHQLRPQLGAQLQLAQARRWPLAGEHLDLVGRAEAGAGTLVGHAGLGLSLRVGDRLAGTAMPAETRLATGRVGAGGRWMLQAGLSVRAVAWDRLIDGPTFGHVSQARHAPWVAEGHLGAAIEPQPGWRVGFALLRRSLDFRSEATRAGRFGPQTYGAITVSVDVR